MLLSKYDQITSKESKCLVISCVLITILSVTKHHGKGNIEKEGFSLGSVVTEQCHVWCVWCPQVTQFPLESILIYTSFEFKLACFSLPESCEKFLIQPMEKKILLRHGLVNAAEGTLRQKKKLLAAGRTSGR